MVAAVSIRTALDRCATRRVALVAATGATACVGGLIWRSGVKIDSEALELLHSRDWYTLPMSEKTDPNQLGITKSTFEALGLEFLGPQAPNGRQASVAPPDVPAETKNVPTFYPIGKSAADATVQLHYAFASRGFHEGVKVRALNEVDEWGSSDHCRLLIDVDTG